MHPIHGTILTMGFVEMEERNVRMSIVNAFPFRRHGYCIIPIAKAHGSAMIAVI
jgi:hypothetical protein